MLVLMPQLSRPSLYAVHLSLLGLYTATMGCTFGLMFYGSLTFGKGLGDLFFMGGHLLGFLALLVLGWASRASRKSQLTGLLTVAVLGQLVFLSLQVTLWRGSEYQWNQQIFLRPLPWAT